MTPSMVSPMRTAPLKPAMSTTGNSTAGLDTDYDWDTDAHLFHASYDASDAFKVAGFVYLIDIPEAGRENLSNTTYGARV
jgi:hypothetical protein